MSENKRYVSVETVCKEIERFKGYLDDDMIYRLQTAIKMLPEPDLVEAVRCRECVFFGKEPEIARALGLETEFYCAIHRDEMGPDFFCSYGRKKPWRDEE